MNNQSTKCPHRDELAAFANGEIPESKFKQLAEHVEECDACGHALDETARQENSGLVAELQGIGLSFPEHPSTDLILKKTQGQRKVPKELLEAVCDGDVRSEVSASFDVGRRLANRLNREAVRLGRFELKSELGVGAFGYVFHAHDTELDRPVALKVLRAGSFATDADMERFLREAQSIAQLNHPGIVSVYDSVQTDEDVCYLVTEFVEGESLESQLEKQKLMPFKETAHLVASICEALQYAHQNGVIHRDIKPSNILIDRDDKPHLMDFGLAKRIQDDGNTLTSMGTVLGTPAYMSPEQAAGDSRNVDARSDIYALGVILYEMLTGERPFQGNRRMLLLQILEDDPRSPRLLNSKVPADLETICLKALSKSQDRRYQSASELAEDLRRFTRAQPILARSMRRSERLWRWCRSYPLAASLLLAVPLVTVGGFAYLSALSTQFVHSTALESTRMEANMLEDINEYYSESVIGPLDQNRVPVTHRYLETPNSIPLPFTFMIDAGQRISKSESGMQVKIYSDYPWREDGGPQDDFELRAIEALGLECRTLSSTQATQVVDDVRRSSKEDVDGRSYHEFDEVNDEPVLRYARAQIMSQSCIDCHNGDSTSPKRDWVVGEVAGVLSITRPLKRDIESTHAGLRSAFYLIASVGGLLTGLTLCVFWSAKRRSIEKYGATFHDSH